MCNKEKFWPILCERIGHPEVDYVVSLTHTDQHFDQIVQLIAPQGKFGLIDDPASLDVGKLKRKSVSLHWEFMFTRALFGTDDMQAQHRLLSEVAALIDAGLIRTTLTERFGSINASNMKKAHALIESGKVKPVVDRTYALSEIAAATAAHSRKTNGSAAGNPAADIGQVQRYRESL